MRISRPLPTSPRMTSPKQLKSVSSLQLNSYKIDTSSLSEKAKQIQQLKTSLESQISQYKTSEIMFHEQIEKLSEENNEYIFSDIRLRAKVKKLETELNRIKVEGPQSPRAKSKFSTKTEQNQIKLLRVTVSSLEDEVASLKRKLAAKNEQLSEAWEYKKMYDIEVQNKNNIMNFYQNKLSMFKKDKGVLISKYQQKISQLGSSLDLNNATIINLQQGNSQQTIKLQQGNSQPTRINSTVNNNVGLNANKMAITMPQGIKNTKELVQYVVDKNISAREVKDKGEGDSQSTRNIKFVRASKPSTNQHQFKQGEKDKSQHQTPYKLLKASDANSSQNQENTPYSNKSLRNPLHQVSVSSSVTGHDNMLVSRDAKAKQSSKKITPNSQKTNKTLRSHDNFLQLIKKVSSNLRSQNIKSENLKNFGPVRSFISVVSPLPSQVIEWLEKFPFGPTEMDRLSLEECIERMRKHLEKRYSTWSGSLLVELLIDKIQDIQIGYEVNSEEDDILAGLSSEDENN